MPIDSVTPEAVAGVMDNEMARLWLSAVHASLRSVGGSVVGSVRPSGPGWNYYQVRVEEPDGRVVRILLNAAAGLVAASSDEAVPEAGPLSFVDVRGPTRTVRWGSQLPSPTSCALGWFPST